MAAASHILPSQRKHVDPVVGAAIEWWASHRPRGWTQAEHLDRPAVACVSARDRQLALLVAKRLREEIAHA